MTTRRKISIEFILVCLFLLACWYLTFLNNSNWTQSIFGNHHSPFLAPFNHIQCLKVAYCSSLLDSFLLLNLQNVPFFQESLCHMSGTNFLEFANREEVGNVCPLSCPIHSWLCQLRCLFTECRHELGLCLRIFLCAHLFLFTPTVLLVLTITSLRWGGVAGAGMRSVLVICWRARTDTSAASHAQWVLKPSSAFVFSLP